MPALHGNWIDLLIILILVYYLSEAFHYGFWGILTSFVSFLGSLVISLRAYKFVSLLLQNNFSLPISYANAFGFIITAVILEAGLNYFLSFLVGLLPQKIREAKYNWILGIIPALGEGIILVAFLLTAIIALPINPSIKKAVTESKIGNLLLEKTSGVEKDINQVFGGAINDALTYFTIEPDSNAVIKLNTGIDHLTIDSASESRMLADVNKERTSRGIAPLSVDPQMTAIARAYAMDMWERHYFSHYNPEGETVADRFTAAGISYQVVGENIALAPTEQTAMTGFMNSPGHKANILDAEFHKIGIGVVDNGIYGKMFVQEFMN